MIKDIILLFVLIELIYRYIQLYKLTFYLYYIKLTNKKVNLHKPSKDIEKQLKEIDDKYNDL